MLLDAARRAAAEERGGVLVIVTLSLPVLVLIASFVIDVANWFEHDRHLQTQADAAALAAAGEFAFPCANEPIQQKAVEYHGGPGASFNEQVGSTPPENIHMTINSRRYYNQNGPDDPIDNTVVEAPPCDARMIDVKLTETDLPWFFKAANVDFINAHARVSLMSINRASGALPVGVQDVNPKAAKVQFVNEATGEVLGSRDLTSAGTSGDLSLWSNSGDPVPVDISAAHIGMRVILSGSNSTTCGQPLVECYQPDAEGGRGIVYIRGWSDGSGAQPSAPKDRSVTLFGGSCTDPYFSAGSCTIGVRANVNFGTNDPVTDVGAKVTAVVGGSSYDLTYQGNDLWESSATINVPANAGEVPVELRWEETKGTQGGNTCSDRGGNKCKGSFGTVQRAFSSVEGLSGPIELAQVSEGGASGANSFERCGSAQSCTHNLVATIGIKGSLKNAADVNDPVVSLRVTGGSQNQSLDCDPDTPNLSDELANGCGPEYKINTGSDCPDSTATLWSSASPWPCVAVQTGTAINQVAKGMNLRVLGSEQPTSCSSPSNWSDFPNIPADDPRIVQVFLTPFGTFSGSGSTTVPVSSFATFYVTGWAGQGGGFANPCEGQGDDPAPDGHIVGHFIKYVFRLNDGDSGDELCDPNGFGSCVAVLTE